MWAVVTSLSHLLHNSVLSMKVNYLRCYMVKYNDDTQ